MPARCRGPQCDVLVEEFEEVIEDWYRNHQEEDLTEFLCTNHVLKGKDTSESSTGLWAGTKRSHLGTWAAATLLMLPTSPARLQAAWQSNGLARRATQPP